jgi:hypothetical protein
MIKHKITPHIIAFAAVLALGGVTTVTAATLTVGNASSLPCTGTFPTIQSAIVAANPGDTISVCPGSYNEQVQVTKTLTLQGAQHGVDARTRATTSESIINFSGGPVQIMADNVTIDGFTIQGSTGTDPNFISGIWTNPGFSGTQGGHQILNNIVQNNISGIELDSTCAANPTLVQHNLIQNNNNPGPGSGTGIQDNFVLCHATIDSNKFVGNSSTGTLLFGPPVTSNGSNITVSNNEFGTNGGAIALLGVTSSTISTNNIHNSGSGADIDIFGGVNGLSVTCNSLAMGAGRGVQVEDPFGVGPNANVTINMNNISGYPTGLEEDTGGYTPVAPNSLDATMNWWGSSTGPTIASNPGGTGEPIIDMDGVVKYVPFLTSVSGCAPCPNMNPGCTTNEKDCQKFVDQQKKNFDSQQQAAKKSFDNQQQQDKKNFEATHPTAAQKKAFDDQQKAQKTNFDNQQKADKASFDQQNKADQAKCEQLPD